MTGRQVLDGQLARLTKAIRILREDGDLILPALMLLYATIDGLAWLQREDPERDAGSGEFRLWVEQYLLPGWTGAVTSDMLWAARCALLHSQAAESRKSRVGEVPEIWYRWSDFGIVPLGANAPMLPLVVDPRQLFRAFDDAVARFRATLDSNSELCQRVEKQAIKLWTPMIYPPEMPKGGM